MTHAPHRHRWSLAAATVFGIGRLRPAPGTLGSMPTLIVASLLIAAGLGPTDQPWVYHAVLGAILIVGSWSCIAAGDAAEARFGSKDPSEVVADEAAGMAIPLMALPGLSGPGSTVFMLAYAFVAFRVFDIVKPWPARSVQRVPAGWGILLDDLIAGVYALIAVQAIARLA